jgi:hypothetical protein
MAAIDDAFNNAFPLASDADIDLIRELGFVIEQYLAAPYSINAEDGVAPNMPDGTVLHLQSSDNYDKNLLVFDGFDSPPEIWLRNADGWAGGPGMTFSGNVTGRLVFSGYYTTGGAAYALRPMSLRGEATEDWSSTSQGSRAVIATTPNGTATPVDALFVDQDQSVLAKGGIGYVSGKGAGGTVTQLTSRTTGVTLNAKTGRITLFSGAGSSAGQTFTLTNNKIKATSNLNINISGSPTGLYYFGIKITAGAAQITVFNPGNNNEAPVLQFAVFETAFD